VSERCCRKDRKLRMGVRMRYLVLTVLALALVPVAGSAQARKDNWENLKQLQPGHKIKVVDMNLKAWDGSLVSVSDEAITIRQLRKQREITVERANVFRVTDLQRSKRRRNALIGLLIGGAIGVPIGVAKSSDLPPSFGALIMFGWLGGPGAAVGALVPSHPAIYRAQREPAENGSVRPKG
jgi:hypothetical protein